MKATQVTLTIVEHEGRRWLFAADGETFSGIGFEPGCCDEDKALALVSQAIADENRQASFFSEILSERDHREAWKVAVAQASCDAQAASIYLGASNDAWTRRIDSSRTTIKNMIVRGSNLKERRRDYPASSSWEQVIANAYQRAALWTDITEWDRFSSDLSSNVRKRFRRLDPGESGTRSDGGYEETEDDQGDAGITGL